MANPTARKILIVDGDQCIVDTLATIFSREGYEANAFTSVAQLLAVLTRWEPDFAFVDPHLTEVSGVEFACELRERFPACKITLLATNIDQLLDELSLCNRMFHILEKPVHPTVLLQTVWTAFPNMNTHPVN